MIIRAKHTEGFLRVLNSVVCDPQLSCEACGLLIRMLSLPDDWIFSAEGLAVQFSLSVKTVRRLVKELREAGYVKFEQKRNAHGFFTASEWLIFEAPDRVPLSGVPAIGIPVNGVTAGGVPVDGTPVGGVTAKGKQLTTNKLTTNEKTTKELTTKKVIPGRGEFENVFISDLEFQKLTDRFGAEVRDARIEDLSRYLAQHPKKKYASHYATVLAWARKEEKETATPAPIPSNNSGGIDWDRVAEMAGGSYDG